MRLLIAIIAAVGLLFAFSVPSATQDADAFIGVDPFVGTTDTEYIVFLFFCEDGSFSVSAVGSEEVLVTGATVDDPAPGVGSSGSFHGSELDGPGEYEVSGHCAQDPEMVVMPATIVVNESTGTEPAAPVPPPVPTPTQPKMTG